MNENAGLELLFQYACEFKFNDFTELLRELEAVQPLEEVWEAYLIRAQIKLIAADISILNDLGKIAEVSRLTRFPPLSSMWPADLPNRFVVFSKAPGALRDFLQTLPLVRKELSRWYGEQGDIAARQIQGEICYFIGEIDQALGLAEEQSGLEAGGNLDALFRQCLRFRCCLAMRRPRQAEECMLEMIKSSRSHPECQAVYQALRTWANLTTNWNGDAPRFYYDAGGRKKPVLEDRLESIRMGYARTTPLEEPFVRYAEQGYGSAYTMRQYYMEIFHAMYWFEAGDRQQTESYFRKLQQIAVDSGVCMPLVEYGEQITPLLRHVKDSRWGCSPQWLDRIISLAEQYEKSLNAYKDADT